MGHSGAIGAAIHVALVAAGHAGPAIQADPLVSQCPAVELVRGAIDRELGPAHGDAMDGWTIRTSRGARPSPASAETIVVEIIDPNGDLRAQRRVEVDPANCVAAAKTVAAIGVRAFRPLEWSPVREAEPAVETDKAVAQVAAAAGPSSERARPTPTLTIAAGPALAIADGASGNVMVDLGVRVGGPLRLRLGGLAVPMHRTEAAGQAGAAHLTRVALLGGVTWNGYAGGVLRLELGPLLGVDLDSARTEDVTAPSAGRRVVLDGGVMAGVALPLGDRWRVGLVGTALAKVLASKFSVDTNGLAREALPPPGFSGVVALRLEGVLFP